MPNYLSKALKRQRIDELRIEVACMIAKPKLKPQEKEIIKSKLKALRKWQSRSTNPWD